MPPKKDHSKMSKAELMKLATAKKKVFCPPLSKMTKQQLSNFLSGEKAPSFKRDDYHKKPEKK